MIYLDISARRGPRQQPVCDVGHDGADQSAVEEGDVYDPEHGEDERAEKEGEVCGGMDGRNQVKLE